ncbi:MAG TPA: GNAT family N-acetyltransferase [Thermoanaerobaculia bacterium]|nr:GNAT family N-acetyltransferase [Thermoanaerobaculia bacterium]
MLALGDFTSRRLTTDDVAIFQDLFERCSDFHELSEGSPTRPDAAAHELASVPPGGKPDDNFVIGIFDSEQLVAVLNLARNFPRPGEWWIGLLMLDPAVRARGLGRRIVEAALPWSAASAMWLGVLEANPRAERFWRRAQFEEVERQDFRSDTGKAHRIILMRRYIAEITDSTSSIT